MIVLKQQRAHREQDNEHGQPDCGGLEQTIWNPAAEQHRGQREQRQPGQCAEQQQCTGSEPRRDRRWRQTGLAEHASLQRGGRSRAAGNHPAERGTRKL